MSYVKSSPVLFASACPLNIYVAMPVKCSENHLRCLESGIAELIKYWPRELYISFGCLSESLHEDTGR